MSAGDGYAIEVLHYSILFIVAVWSSGRIRMSQVRVGGSSIPGYYTFGKITKQQKKRDMSDAPDNLVQRIKEHRQYWRRLYAHNGPELCERIVLGQEIVMMEQLQGWMSTRYLRRRLLAEWTAENEREIAEGERELVIPIPSLRSVEEAPLQDDLLFPETQDEEEERLLLGVDNENKAGKHRFQEEDASEYRVKPSSGCGHAEESFGSSDVCCTQAEYWMGKPRLRRHHDSANPRQSVHW